MTNYHVTPDADKGWMVKKDGGKRGVFSPTQGGAEKIAKRLVSRSGGGEVVIHGRDGRIRDKDTVPPANDPFPPRDMRH